MWQSGLDQAQQDMWHQPQNGLAQAQQDMWPEPQPNLAMAQQGMWRQPETSLGQAQQDMPSQILSNGNMWAVRVPHQLSTHGMQSNRLGAMHQSTEARQAAIREQVHQHVPMHSLQSGQSICETGCTAPCTVHTMQTMDPTQHVVITSIVHSNVLDNMHHMQDVMEPIVQDVQHVQTTQQEHLHSRAPQVAMPHAMLLPQHVPSRPSAPFVHGSRVGNVHQSSSARPQLYTPIAHMQGTLQANAPQCYMHGPMQPMQPMQVNTFM